MDRPSDESKRYEALPAPVVGILQPSYLPWLGAFDMMDACDLWIFYDDVQYTRRDWRNRNRIKGPGGPEYLTVPVVKAPRSSLIRDIRIHDETGWAQKHLAKLRTNYHGSPHVDDIVDRLEDGLAACDGSLANLCMETTRSMAAHLGVRCQFSQASDIGVSGKGAERILALCNEVGAASYVNGAAGRDLYDERAFAEIGVQLVFHDYTHPVYEQPHPPFESHLSIVDLLVGYTPKVALELIRSGSNLPGS